MPPFLVNSIRFASEKSTSSGISFSAIRGCWRFPHESTHAPRGKDKLDFSLQPNRTDSVQLFVRAPLRTFWRIP